MSFTHRCQFTDKSDYRTALSPKQSRSFRFTEFIKSLITIDWRHPKCKQYLISNATVSKERRGQFLQAHTWIIHPFSTLRYFWEIIMTIVYLVAFTTIPFMICCIVLDYEKIYFDNINPLIYVICWIDIIGNCITGYYNQKDKEFILNQKKILKNYAKKFFFLDVLTSLPYDRITYKWRTVPGPNTSFFIAVINLTPIFKLFRYFTLSEYLFQLFTHFNFQYFSYQMFSMMLLYVFVFYWFACFCYVMPILLLHGLKITAEECLDCFFVQAKLTTITKRFRQSVFIVLENFSASSFGIIIPETPSHIMLCTILMLVGRVFECYIIITFLKISSSRNAPESEYQQVIDEVNTYANQKQFPRHIKQRLLSLYHYRFKNSYFRESDILANLSVNLRKEILLHSCRRLLENVTIFQNLPKEQLISIVTVLKPELFLPNDVIIKAGMHGDCMYFLDTGTVAIYTPKGREISHFEDGAYFGEISLLVQDQKRIATVVAIAICEVYRLDRKDFRKYVALNKELMKNIERSATSRMEQTILMDEHIKAELGP